MEKPITVYFANRESCQYQAGITLLEISHDVQHLYTTAIVAAKVNNEIKDLQFVVTTDCTIDFFDLRTELGIKVYQRSLTFVMIAAAYELFPHGETTVEHSLSKGLYCELHIGEPTTEDHLKALEMHMRKIIDENRSITMKSVPIAEAIELFRSSGQIEKVKHLEQLKRERVRIYYCGQSYGYFYGMMMPDTKNLKIFSLKKHESGFILRFPEKERPDCLPEFVPQTKLSEIFLEAERWGKILKCGYVATLNEYVHNNKVHDIIRVTEALHEKKIGQIADFVFDNKDVRVILVAGPSSSGKTTFAQRLTIQLKVNGLNPVALSLDDYFIDRDRTPRDENGDYDFESIEAIDLQLFNEHLRRILDGEAVKVPSYNFMVGQREYRGHIIQIEKNQPLIIEGIHGLNERLSASVPSEHKVKIYVSALTQLSIDNHNRILTTDTRLLRRIVRDSQFRSHDALKTLRMWSSVRRGEERNIFPFQEDADIMFNSGLIYELGVLKKYAEPLLKQITSAEEEYPEAKRLLNFLSYFENIADDEIPLNSILREFTGSSCFYR
ncbi:nucleoside kinase [Pelosinus sp. sgz500959]|uniref:nucleoside kinase n=1 Tax=Pelosinus sp. sgz500959 TaxID=3242472 RepID=UPI00366E97F5